MQKSKNVLLEKFCSALLPPPPSLGLKIPPWLWPHLETKSVEKPDDTHLALCFYVHFNKISHANLI